MRRELQDAGKLLLGGGEDMFVVVLVVVVLVVVLVVNGGGLLGLINQIVFSLCAMSDARGRGN